MDILREANVTLDYECDSFIHKDSLDMTDADRQMLFERIESDENQRIVVTHGTDTMIADPRMVTEQELERWLKDFDSWDVCDQCCNNLFCKTNFAYQKAMEWSLRREEFVKRAGFVLMACLAVHDKGADDIAFRQFFSIVKSQAADERNFVKKSINWALRQIGKRNRTVNAEAIDVATDLKRIDSKSARWIARDALREKQQDPEETGELICLD